MGKAAKAPPPTYKRKYWVTEHAIEQLRSRFEKQGTTHRNETDLGNLIDLAVDSCINKAEDIIDNGIESRVVPLHKTLGDRLWALLKPNTRSRNHEYSVVTLLKDHQVEASKKSGKWESPLYEDKVSIGGIPENQLAKLQSIPVIDKGPEPVSTHNGKVSKGEVTASVLISWWNADEGKRIYEEYLEKDVAEDRLNEVTNDSRCKPGSIQVWRPAKIRLAL